MKQRVITAAVLIGILVPAVLIGGIFFKIVGLIFMTVGCYEVTKLFNEKWNNFCKVSIYVLYIGSLLVSYIDTKYVAVCQCITLVYLFFLLVQFEEIKLEHIGVTFMVYMLLMMTIVTVLQLHEINKWMIFLLLMGTYLTDAFALFGGMAFGKHKLNVRISPNKTIEGSLCGYLVGAISCLIFSFLVLKGENRIVLITSSLLMPLVGQIGDLAFSAIKRHYNIKDFGNIFPGHGGVLDRIDSLTFNCVIMYGLMSIIL